MTGLNDPDSNHPAPRPEAAARPRRALSGLNPMGLMDAAITGHEDSREWQPPDAAELEGLMDGYESFSFIDRGGMGAVYAATQKSLSRRVAIKILPAELGADENFVRLFEREGHMLGQMQHPHIVAVYASGRTRSGHLYIVMEYVEGITLLEILKDKQPTVTRALEITSQVCDALTYAHGRGVIHLDIKPGNILIDERGFVRVADFGLSRNLEKQGAASAASRSTRGFIGTVGYAAPEQRRTHGSVDHRTDIFSLGVTLYEMLTRCLPVGVFDPPSKKAGTHKHVDKIVLRAMREAPEHRYQSAAEMRSAIAGAMLRLGTPLVKRAIISRPMISMATSVMIGMGFIYLLDGLNRLAKPWSVASNQSLMQKAQPMEAMDMDQPPDPAFLDNEWALIRVPWRWDLIETRLKDYPGWQLAEIYSEQELNHVMKLLREHQFSRPLSLGAVSDEEAPEVGFHWLSGTPMEYQPWVPASTGQPVIITEIQAKNARTLKTPGGETPDWIEIHNPGPAAVDITGYHLRHYYGAQSRGSVVVSGWLTRDVVPERQSMLLQPGEYRLICCSPRMRTSDGYTQMSFSLEGSSGRLEWYDPQGVLLQRFGQSWRSFPEDASLGQSPDGSQWGWCQTATPGLANSTVTSPFPAPTKVSTSYQKIIMLPEFGGRWARCPRYVSNHTLLRRLKK